MKLTAREILTLAVLTISSTVFAEGNRHAQEAIEQLDRASDNAKAGDVEGTVQGIDQAKKHAILHEAKHPFHEPAKATANERFRRKHTRRAFETMNKAKDLARKGDTAGAAEAAGEAEKQLRNEGRHDQGLDRSP